jgi:hypothetical protein
LGGFDRENGGNAETGRFTSCTSANEVIAILVGDGDAREVLGDLCLLAAEIERRLGDRAEVVEVASIPRLSKKLQAPSRLDFGSAVSPPRL